jgi:hypothetical protein
VQTQGPPQAVLALTGSMMLAFLIALPLLEESGLDDLGQLTNASLLCGLLTAQAMLAVALAMPRVPLAPAIPAIALAAVLGGIGLPPLINHHGPQGEGRWGEPLEVSSRTCRASNRAPQVRLRLLHGEGRSVSMRLPRRQCLSVRAGDVVRVEYAPGALGAEWRRGIESTGDVGPWILDQQAWAASEEHDWSTCIARNRASLRGMPEGDGGRIQANLGWCLRKAGDHREGLAVAHEACAAGWTKTCDWLQAYENDYRRRHGLPTVP